MKESITKDMKIGIADADLIGRKKHRFPNLACMKLSGYYKAKGHEVQLLTDYDTVENYDKVCISKVFTDTNIPENILNLSWVEYGGTGFYFDKAPNLPDAIEHHFPDYHLYDDFVNGLIKSGAKKNEFKEYTDYSIGFLTRGCFRKCGFCVNQKYNRVFKHSPLSEFYDPERKKICLLDDNFLGCSNWKEMLQELIDTNKPFKFKQGLDERLLTDEKCEMLFNSKYDGDITFAFDRIEDYKSIEKKLQLIRKHTSKQCIFYVLCGFDGSGRYNNEFWLQDIIDTFERINLLGSYGCLPYLMRYNKHLESPYRGLYVTLARWLNQFRYFKKQSLYEFTKADFNSGGKASGRYLKEFTEEHPKIAEKYFYKKYFVKE